jgi:hypothetical protein
VKILLEIILKIKDDSYAKQDLAFFSSGLYKLGVINNNMATLPIIPRLDGEGSLGIETKQWGDVQTKKLNDITLPQINLEIDENKIFVVKSTGIETISIEDAISIEDIVIPLIIAFS